MSAPTKSKPPVKPADLTFKQRLTALGNLPAFFKLVWATNRWMTLGNSLLRISRAGLPLAILYVGKLIIDQVVLLAKATGATSHQHLWELVAAEFGLVLLSDILSRTIN